MFHTGLVTDCGDTGLGRETGERDETHGDGGTLLKCMKSISHTPPTSAKGTESMTIRVSPDRQAAIEKGDLYAVMSRPVAHR